MGCLFDCFRARNDESTSDSVSQLNRLNSKRGHDSKKSLSALFLSEEKASSSPPCHDREGSGLDTMHIGKGLKNELQAQFLKACGQIPGTPIETSKESKNLDTPQRGSSQFDSWISSNSDAVFHSDEKTVESCEEVGGSLVTSEQTPSSCLTNARNSDAGGASQESIGTAFRDAVDSTGKVPLAPGNITGKTKSVRMEFDFDRSYSSSSSEKSTSRKPDMAGETNLSATSLKRSDEIQTPRNIFPANMDSQGNERPGIRSHSAHSVSNLNENTAIGKLSQDSDEQANVQVCKEKTENESPTSVTCGGKLEQSSDETYQMSETSVQSKEESNKNMVDLFTRTPGDRPIIGMVALHWKEEEQSQISPKWWDGKGIPNSTNKYKEDQKVSWHATSFEERLEKALSEEGSQGFIPPRKLGLMEEAERDTAISQLQHSTQSKSVVSF